MFKKRIWILGLSRKSTSDTNTDGELSDVIINRLHSHAKENEFRRSSFDVILAYNFSDWSSGYMGTLGGFTAFFTIPGSQSSGELSHVPRAMLPDGISTRVIINQVHQDELGYPYGTCLKKNTQHSDILNDMQNSSAEGNNNKHDSYSDTMCMYECRMDAVIAMCSCSMAHDTIRYINSKI